MSSSTSRRSGAPRELGRYRITSGERVIYGQRVLGIVRVVDVPGGGRGRRYIIERGLTSKSELEAIVADYLQQATVWDAVPAEPVCLLEITGAAR